MSAETTEPLDAEMCGAVKPGTYGCSSAIPTCALTPGHDGNHRSARQWVPGNQINAFLRPEKGYWLAPSAWPCEQPQDVATWHSEIMRAGVDGLHANDCWDSDDHQDCRDIVFAVLSGLADAGYRVAKPA